MLTPTQASTIADAMIARMGETSLAAAVWQAQQAAARGDLRKLADWALIAETMQNALPEMHAAG